jgi:hypothetical protein
MNFNSRQNFSHCPGHWTFLQADSPSRFVDKTAAEERRGRAGTGAGKTTNGIGFFTFAALLSVRTLARREDFGLRFGGGA